MKGPALITLALLLVQLNSTSGSKILVFPFDGSHWVNMKVIIGGLHARGHEITVIRTSNSWYISNESPHYSTITLAKPGGYEKRSKTLVSQRVALRLSGQPTSLWSRLRKEIRCLREFYVHLSKMHKEACDFVVQIFEDENLMQSLHEAKYDLMLTDPYNGGGSILARRLQLPLVYNVRWTIKGDAQLLVAPSPMSYIPYSTLELTDRMTFPERVYNVFEHALLTNFVHYAVAPHYDALVKRYLGPDVDFSTVFMDPDLWLMRVDFVFEFPRPTLPNLVYIGGFHCRPAKPLTAELEEFVQSSGDHGVIVMSLGTIVGELPQHVAEEIAAAFAQLPQKVLWRYIGQRPANLGNNTLMVDWLPQNDLLGHPKTRVFVSHGGTNGIQEAIYHGVPIVGLPLFFDQPNNLCKIKARGGAVTVEISSLDRHSFAEALRKPLYNSSYKESMQKMSRLHRDQPMTPMDQAMYWIEYVIRHKGAAHLKSKYYKMSWFVENSVDVIAALLLGVLVIIFICISIVKLLCRGIFAGEKIKNE